MAGEPIRVSLAGKRLQPYLTAVLIFALAAFAIGPARAGLLDADCDEGHHSLQGQAIYRICMPRFWNGDLVVYAHGYVSPSHRSASRRTS